MLAPTLDDWLPDTLDRFLSRALGRTVPRLGSGGRRYRVTATGSFRSRMAPDLLHFAHNQGMDAALLLVDRESVRVLYFAEGAVVGCDSNVVFERLGRIMRRRGLLDEETARQVEDLEERMGLLVATGLVPEEALKQGLEARAWEVGASLPLLASGHFAFVEGTPDLEPLPRVEIRPTELVIEGLRRYDEWRNRPIRNGASAHATP